MIRSGRFFCTLTVALAVLLMSATCTSAGCLLTLVSGAASRGESVAPCCSDYSGSRGNDAHLPGRRDSKKDCPLCHSTVLLGQTVDRNHSAMDHPALPACLAPVPFACDLHDATQDARSTAAVDEAAGSRTPPTLLALHCALLR